MEGGFDWDAEKARENFRKHGVAFDEAVSVFFDPRAILVYDEGHSQREDRFLSIGRSSGGRVIVVAYTEREGVTRIISARESTKTERKSYEEKR